ncbi:MAG: hypothetical protein R3D71_00115 [Rickettsiales bacterium]
MSLFGKIKFPGKSSSVDRVKKQESLVERQAQHEAFEQLGEYHLERVKSLTFVLRCWLVIAFLFFIIIVLFYLYYPNFFVKNMPDIKGFNAFSQDNFFVLYYTARVSGFIILISVFFWILRRVVRLQVLRSIHADKGATANTLQKFLDLGYVELGENTSKFIFEPAFKELFSSNSERLSPKLSNKELDLVNKMFDYFKREVKR